LLRFLATISDTVANELKPDLQSGQAKKSADYLVQVLNRLVAQYRDADRVATGQLAAWQELQRQMPVATRAAAPASSVAAGPLEQLQTELDAMQLQLSSAQNYAALCQALVLPASSQSLWLREAASATSRLWEALEQTVVDTPPRPKGATTTDDPELLRGKLNAYLGAHDASLPKDVIATLRIASGGSTKLTALLSLQANARLPQRLVLRQDIAGNMTGTLIRDEYPIVERLAALGVSVPQPVLLETDATVLGGAFMLMTEIADAAPAGTYFARDRALQPFMIGPQFARDAAAELARLHRLTAVTVANAEATAAAQRAGVVKAFERWKTSPKPPQSLGVDLGFAWLMSHPLAADRPRCLIHGDYGVHNMMAREGRLAGVLDWELAQEDDPAIDLAECRMLMCEDTLPWEEFAAAYVQAGGDPRACQRDAVDYYCVWMFSVKFGMMLSEARNYYISGMRTDSLTASAASHSMDRILQYLARALQLATRQNEGENT
jgi:aminoglycoside phosphotransferase (APT) family kinase protein